MHQSTLTDRAYSLKDLNERRIRESMLRLPHIAPLEVYRERLQKELSMGIPHFDPLDGGIDARMLIVLETPGPRAVSTNFVSRNNPDPTAKNLFNTCASLDIRRQDTIIWNIAPWFISTETQSKNARDEDARRGIPLLLRLLAMLPNLSEVVLCGGKAKLAAEEIRQLGTYRVTETYHFAARAYNIPSQKQQIMQKMQPIADRLKWQTQNPPSMSGAEGFGLIGE